MPVTYPSGRNSTTLYASVHTTMLAAMERFTPELKERGVLVDTLVCENVNKDGEVLPALKLHGLACAAIASINNLQKRAEGLGDCKIRFDGHVWNKFTEANRLALCHHELLHFLLDCDEDGQPESDDLGRPKLVLAPHDWESSGFAKVAEVHGANAIEVITATEIHRKYGNVMLPA